jgi:hypothetical protein
LQFFGSNLVDNQEQKFLGEILAENRKEAGGAVIS